MSVDSQMARIMYSSNYVLPPSQDPPPLVFSVYKSLVLFHIQDNNIYCGLCSTIKVWMEQPFDVHTHLLETRWCNIALCPDEQSAALFILRAFLGEFCMGALLAELVVDNALTNSSVWMVFIGFYGGIRFVWHCPKWILVWNRVLRFSVVYYAWQVLTFLCEIIVPNFPPHHAIVQVQRGPEITMGAPIFWVP